MDLGLSDGARLTRLTLHVEHATASGEALAIVGQWCDILAVRSSDFELDDRRWVHGAAVGYSSEQQQQREPTLLPNTAHASLQWLLAHNELVLTVDVKGTWEMAGYNVFRVMKKGVSA